MRVAGGSGGGAREPAEGAVRGVGGAAGDASFAAGARTAAGRLLLLRYLYLHALTAVCFAKGEVINPHTEGCLTIPTKGIKRV